MLADRDSKDRASFPLLQPLAEDDIFRVEAEEQRPEPEKVQRPLTWTTSLFGIRLVSILFSNMKLIYIAVQLAAICDINYSIAATQVSSSCSWYWGSYLYANTDDYSYSPEINVGNSGREFRMTCGYQNCSAVCPGDCSGRTWEGETLDVEGNHGQPTNACTITFDYLQVTWALVLTALCADALVQFVIGSHMVFTHIWPDRGNWFFLKNLHQRSIFVALVYFLRPGLMYRRLVHPSSEIYPSMDGVDPVPFTYFMLFSLCIDIPYAIGSFFWALFSGDALSVYLVIASCLNILASFMYAWCLQIRQDLERDESIA